MTTAKVVLNSNTADNNLVVQSQRENEELPLEASGFLELLVGDIVTIQTLSDLSLIHI